MKITKQFNILSEYATAIVNDDYSGLTDEDERLINKFFTQFYPNNVHMVIDNNEPEFMLDDISGLMGDCLRVSCIMPDVVRIDRDEYPIKTKLLWWQERGLMHTATGYGSKIPTSEMINVNNRWYRIYCSIHSNVGTCYIITKGAEIIVD